MARRFDAVIKRVLLAALQPIALDAIEQVFREERQRYDGMQRAREAELGRARQTLDRLGLGDLTVFDRAEYGEQLVHLYLLDVHIMQVIAREGLEVFGRFNQPVQDGVRINLENPGDSADAEPFSQSRNGPH
jgi:hypothetical protein